MYVVAVQYSMATSIHDINFDGPAYTPGSGLTGIAGWTGVSDLAPSSILPLTAIISSDLAFSGSNSLRKDASVVRGADEGATAWFWRSIPGGPIANGSSTIVVSQVMLSYAQASLGADFGLGCFDPLGNQLAGILLNTQNGLVFPYQDLLPATLPVVQPGDWNRMMIVTDMASGEVRTFFNQTPIGTVGSTSGWNLADADLFVNGQGTNLGFFDDYRVDSFGPGRIRCKMDLPNWAATPVGIPVLVEIRNPSTGGVIQSLSTALDAKSEFEVSTSQRGIFNIAAKASGWISKAFLNQEITNSGVYHLTFGNIIGDVDGDNEIGPSDFEAVVNGFGNNDPASDVDGDGEVGPSDFELIVAGFGTSGD
jgi:hypothetical protein